MSKKRSFPVISLRTRFILAFVGVGVFSIASVALHSYYSIRVNLTQQVGANLTKTAASNAQAIGELITRNLEVLKILALNSHLQDELAAAGITRPADSAQVDALDKEWRAADEAGDDTDPLVASVLNHPLSEELRLFRKTSSEHVEVFVTDTNGAIIAATNRTSDYNQADEDWWQKAYNNGLGGIYIGEPEFDESSHTYAINMAVPVEAPDDTQIVGVLRTTVSIGILVDLLKAANFGQTGRVDLRLHGNQLITADAAGFMTLDPAESPRLDALSGGYGELTYKGSPSLVSQMPVSSFDVEVGETIAQLGWVTVAYQEQEEALRPVNTVVRSSLLNTLASLSITSLLAVFMAQRTIRPILRLTEAAKNAAAGNLTVQAPVDSADEIGLLAQTFNQMTLQLRQTLEGLEQRVASRTRALQTSAEVSRRLSTILDQERLVKEVVDQVQLAFGYYHAHIYLFDEKHEYLVMAGGTGEAGSALLARGHKIPRGRGLVSRAAETNTPVFVVNVKSDPYWLPNPLLPETRCEVAVPIALGKDVLGVLDVQHNVVEGLSQLDADLLQSIANQVAIALQNARAYTRARQQADREALIASLGQQIQSATTINDVLQVAIGELAHKLRASRARAELGGLRSLPSDTRYEELA